MELGLVSVGRAMLNQTLVCLSSDSGAVIPPSCLLGLRLSSTGDYRLLGGLTLMSIPQNHCCQCLCPYSEPQLTLPHQETLQYKQVGLAQESAFPLGPGAHRSLCMPSEG